MNSDVRQLDDMRRRWEAAENNHTVDDVVAMMADDAVLMVPDFAVQEGRDACAQFVRAIDADLAGAFDRRIEYVSAEVRVLGDTAFDRGSFSFVVFFKDSIEARINRGKYFVLYMRTRGEWKISRFIVSRDDPEDVLRVRDVTADDLPLIKNSWKSHISPEQLLRTPAADRTVDALVWELNGEAVGITALSDIQSRSGAAVTLHMFDPERRRCGYSHRFFALTLREFMQRYESTHIICEPPSRDPAPNRLLQKLGFVPSQSSGDSEVHRYEIAAVPPAV